MKKPYLYQRLSVVVILLLYAFAINSCKKDQHAVSDNNPAIEEAKVWYNALYPKQAIGKQVNTISGDIDFSQLTSPDWDQSKTYTRLGDEVIEMPLAPGNPLGMGLKDMSGKQTPYTPSHSRSSFIILKKGDSYQAYIMTIIADSAYLKGDLDKLNNNRYNKRDSDFTGAVLYFTPKGNIVSGWFYKQGVMASKLNTNPAEAAAHSASLQKQASAYRSSTLVMVTTCTDWEFYVTTPAGTTEPRYGGINCVTRYYNTGGGSTPGSTPGGGSTSGGSGTPGSTETNPCKTLLAYKSTNDYHTTGSPTPKPPGGYDGDDDNGFPPPTAPTDPVSDPCPPLVQQTQIINNRVKDSCLHRMVEAAIARNINYNLSESMNGIFNTSTNFNLDFVDEIIYNKDGSINYTTDGMTGITNSSATTIPGTSRLNVLSMNVKIALNLSTLPNSSEEYVTATILHEALHAYFRATNISFDHQVMVNQYIPWYKKSLSTIYPNMTDGDLIGLAYGGLMDEVAFQVSSEYSMKSIYNIVNDSYKEARSGTKCK